MPKVPRNILKGVFGNPLKTSVAIAMFIALGGLTVVLIAGLLVPKSVLLKLSENSSSTSVAQGENTNASTIAADKSAQTTDVSTNSTAPSTDTTTPSAGGTAPTTTGTTKSTGGSSSGTTTPSTGSAGSTGTTPAASVAPTLTFGTTKTITTGATAVLAWYINSTATTPVTCTGAGGTFAGSKATSGSQSVTPTSTIGYTLVCSNSAGTSGTKTVTITVTAPVSCGAAGGSCTAAQVATHNSQSNCWVIYSGNYYVLSGSNLPSGRSSYPSSHPGGSVVFNASTCGKDIASFMNGSAGNNGQHSHSGSAYSVLNSYKVGPVN